MRVSPENSLLIRAQRGFRKRRAGSNGTRIVATSSRSPARQAGPTGRRMRVSPRTAYGFVISADSESAALCRMECALSRLRREVLPGRQDLLAVECGLAPRTAYRFVLSADSESAALGRMERPLSRLRREVLPGRQDLLAIECGLAPRTAYGFVLSADSESAAQGRMERPLSRLRREVLPGRQDLHVRWLYDSVEWRYSD
jgi:hypothetical protein